MMKPSLVLPALLLLALPVFWGCGGGDDAAADANPGADGGAGGDGGGGGSPDGSVAAGQFYPCDVEAALRAKCWTCHTDGRMPSAARSRGIS